jgi:hypothetical protein
VLAPGDGAVLGACALEPGVLVGAPVERDGGAAAQASEHPGVGAIGGGRGQGEDGASGGEHAGSAAGARGARGIGVEAEVAVEQERGQLDEVGEPAGGGFPVGDAECALGIDGPLCGC